MKFKHILALLIFGMVLILIGAGFKLMSWSGAGELLISGMGLIGLSMLSGAVKLIMYNKKDSILDK